ncbi:MAG: PHP domain-containing protein [Eubacteriaceae bacterium]|nr:PHP domain-containing protein [Eubacteriaceae bacterium]
MRLTGDFHTHTIYSHGKNTIEENVKSAIEKGLSSICITDHGGGHFFYGVKKKQLYKMRDEIKLLRDKYKNINIYLGIEANIINQDGTIDADEYSDILDYLLVGMHYLIRFDKFMYYYFMNFFARYMGLFKNYCKKRNTEIFIRCINKYDNIFAFTHPGERFFIDIDKLSKACAEKNIALEINNRHGYMTAEDAKIAAANGVKILVSSDAHKSCQVGNIEKCLNILKDANIKAFQIINVEEE